MDCGFRDKRLEKLAAALVDAHPLDLAKIISEARKAISSSEDKVKQILGSSSEGRHGQ